MAAFCFYGLIAILLIFFLTNPFFTLTPFGFISLEIFLSCVLISTVYVLSESPHYLKVGVALVIPALLLSWSNIVSYSILRQAFSYFFDLAFLIFAIAMIGRKIFRSKQININTILGAICIYTLAGIAWGVAYTFIEMVQPGSFGGELLFRTDPDIIDQMAEKTVSLIYFSITTLTTVGYGDIYPINPLARSLALIEALWGVFYMATMIATLVGIRTRTHTL